MKHTRSAAVSLCLAVLAATGSARHSHAAPGPEKPAKLGQELFLAVTHRDAAAVRSLLARGADPNARNYLQLTPLMFAAASRQPEVVQHLLAAGAQIEATSPFGTPLTFAAMGGSAPVAELLLARGASVNAQRPDQITVLMLAARDGHADLIRRLLAMKLDVNARDSEDASALLYAARAGQTDVVRLLLARGAAVNAADSQGWTALTAAASAGHTACVELLLERGADPNAKDRQGRTPLMIAAGYSDQPAVVQALAQRGADLRATDRASRTALMLATARGHTRSAQALRDRGADTTVSASMAPERSPRTAAAAGLKLLEHSMDVFAKRTGCASCHQEGLGRMATGLARERGITINSDIEQAQARRIYDFLGELRPLLFKAVKDPSAMKDVPLTEIEEFTPGIGFLLAGMAAHGKPAHDTLAAAALVLARQQAPEGHWRFGFLRAPMQSSTFTMTALAIRAMKVYAPRRSGAEVAERIRRAKTWMLAAPAESTEDATFRLLGLKWAGATQEERARAVEALGAAQRPDGGWGQLSSLGSDAYATGQVLYSLNQAGDLPVTDSVYQRGVRFLLRKQEDDGSWYVAKSAIPANNYFDAGFPHGHSQYSSFAATTWATMALLLAGDGPAAELQAARQ